MPYEYGQSITSIDEIEKIEAECKIIEAQITNLTSQIQEFIKTAKPLDPVYLALLQVEVNFSSPIARIQAHDQLLTYTGTSDIADVYALRDQLRAKAYELRKEANNARSYRKLFVKEDTALSRFRDAIAAARPDTPITDWNLKVVTDAAKVDQPVDPDDKLQCRVVMRDLPFLTYRDVALELLSRRFGQV
jgi:cell division protein FtsB